MILLLLNHTHRYRNEVATYKQIPQIVLTFILVSIGWILFRAPNIETAWGFICSMCNISIFSIPVGMHITRLVCLLICIITMIVFEWKNRTKSGAPIPHNHIVYYILLFAIWWFSGGASSDFIYFQF